MANYGLLGSLAEHLHTGANEMSKDLFGLPGEDFFIGWDVPPTTPAPGTKRCRLCASPWGALTVANELELTGLHI